MAVSAVADDIDDNILVKRQPVLGGKPHDVNRSFRVFPVHMKDGDHQHFCHIGGITGAAGIFGKCCIADLIIDHQVDGAPGSVTGQLAHVQGFSHDSLSGKGGIAMDQQRKNKVLIIGTQQVQPGAGKSLNNRIDRLQMAGVI